MPDNKKKKSSKKAIGAKPLRQTTLFESTSSPARPQPSPKPKSSRVLTPGRPKRKRDSSESSDIGAIRLGPATPVKQEEIDRSSPSPPSRVKRRRVIVESDSDDKEGQSSDSESSGAVVPRKRRLRKLAPRPSDSSGEDSRPARRLSLKKKDQVNSDDDDNEVDEDRIIKSRLRIRGKKTAFQKNLERLKRKKSGKPMSSSESSEEEDEESQSEEDNSKPFKGARPTVDDSLFTEDEDESDSSSFIVEDDSQNAAAQLPSEFSMRSHDDLTHQFKIVFQFFVHVAVRPSRDRQGFMENQMRHQEYFSFPLRIIRRKLSGLRDSLVASSVWRPKFKKALEDNPTLEVASLLYAVPSCDACHLGGRMSTLLGRLGGIPYNKVGFVDNIMSDSEDGSSEGSEKSVTNLKKSKHGFLEFHMGRFCARRVKTYHAFCHWEYHLFNAISSELDDVRAAPKQRGFVRVGTSGRHPPKDFQDADGLCEWLDELGIIDREWQKLNTMMESAHNLEISAKRGEED